MNKVGVVLAVAVAASFCVAAEGFAGAGADDLVREALLQQSAAERAGCAGVQRALTAGTDAGLVVRTAVEVGFNSCRVIRCALAGKTESDTARLCEKVIRGAVDAGVEADVITRCSSAACDSGTVAGILAGIFIEPNYCYFAPRPLAAPEGLPTLLPVIGRSQPASPFTF